MAQGRARRGWAQAAVAAGLCALSAHSVAGWSLVTVGASHITYVDKEAAAYSGDRSQRVIAPALINYLKPSSPDQSPSARQSSVFELSLDCDKKLYKAERVKSHALPMGEGAGEPERSLAGQSEWSPYTEGGMASAMARALCPSPEASRP